MAEKVSLPYTTIVGVLAIASVLLGGSLVSNRQKLLRQLHEREQLHARRALRLQAETKKAQNEAAALDQEAASLRRERDQLLDHNTSLGIEMAELRRAEEAARRHLPTLEAELASLHQELELLQQSKDVMEQQLSRVMEEKAQVEAELRIATQRSTSLEAERDHLAEQVRHGSGAVAEGPGQVELAPVQVGTAEPEWGGAGVVEEGVIRPLAATAMVGFVDPSLVAEAIPPSPTLGETSTSWGAFASRSVDDNASAFMPEEVAGQGAVEFVDQVYQFAVINQGEQDGVSTGTQFDVLRGGRKLGELRVVNTRREISAADILNVISGEEVQAGDVIVRR